GCRTRRRSRGTGTNRWASGLREEQRELLALYSEECQVPKSRTSPGVTTPWTARSCGSTGTRSSTSSASRRARIRAPGRAEASALWEGPPPRPSRLAALCTATAGTTTRSASATRSGPPPWREGARIPTRPGRRSSSSTYSAPPSGPEGGVTGSRTRAPDAASAEGRARPPASSSSGTKAQTTVPAVMTVPSVSRRRWSIDARVAAGTASLRARTARRIDDFVWSISPVCVSAVVQRPCRPGDYGVGMTSHTSDSPFRTAVVPAAGLGTRFLPATKTVPKELLPVVDTPGIELIAEEATEAGAGRLAIITSERKVGVMAHFSEDAVLEGTLEDRGKDVLLHKVQRAPGLIEVVDVRQEEPLGLGHAVAQVEDVLGAEEEAVAVLLPDDLIMPFGILRQMSEVRREHGGSVL